MRYRIGLIRFFLLGALLLSPFFDAYAQVEGKNRPYFILVSLKSEGSGKVQDSRFQKTIISRVTQLENAHFMITSDSPSELLEGSSSLAKDGHELLRLEVVIEKEKNKKYFLRVKLLKEPSGEKIRIVSKSGILEKDLFNDLSVGLGVALRPLMTPPSKEND